MNKHGVKGTTTKRKLDPRKGVKWADIPECVGNPKAPHRGFKQEITVRGFDNKWRCLVCQKIHVELTYREAGESFPEGVGNFIPVSKQNLKKRADQMAAIKKQYRPGGKYYDKPMVSENGLLVNLENVREASSMARRMPQGHGETSRGYGNRVVQAYRDMIQERGRR